MPKHAHPLTARHVETITEPGAYADGLGLYLQVTKSGTKSWFVRYSAPNGKRREMGLGSVKIVSLADARVRTIKLRKQLLDGVDPLAQKGEARSRLMAEIKTLTLEECARQYYRDYGKKWRPSTARNWWVVLNKHVLPKLGEMSVADITQQHVVSVIQPIWDMTSAPVILKQVHLLIEWATARGMRPDGPNPADHTRLKFILAAPNRKKEVHREALHWRDIPAFMTELRNVPGIAARTAELMILSASRSGEVVGALWREFDLDLGLWNIPASRMKGNEAHTVPLSMRMVEILNEMAAIRQNDLVFPSSQSASATQAVHTPLAIIKSIRPGITAHGFRSTIYDWAMDNTDELPELLDVVLAHKVKDEVRAAYMRAQMIEKRRRFMQRWDDYCAGKTEQVVVPFRR